MTISLNKKMKPFAVDSYRYKIAYGGRGSSKSWSVARMLLLKGMEKKIRILCTREIQNSIKDSVHKLFKDQIDMLKLPNWEVTDKVIRNGNGTEIIFQGLYSNLTKIKSLEGIDYCWIEEAEAISAASWEVLDPTIRKPNSEIWITFNPRFSDDVIYKTFVLDNPPNAIVIKVNHDDNIHFPDVLKEQMEYMKRTNYELYLHIWEGECRTSSDAQIFKDKYRVDDFIIDDTFGEPLYGIDFGFSQDPTTANEIYIKDRKLYIRYEACKVGLELDDTADYITKRMPNIINYASRADSARPESISYLRRNGLPKIEGVQKWPGSIEDGIEHMKSYEEIIIHPDCVNTAREFASYSYKIDKRTNDILPKIEDNNNHNIDGIRYALTPLIRNNKAEVKSISLSFV